MPSANVHIYRYSSGCCKTKRLVERTMPAIMNGRVDRTDWVRFCDQVDEHLKPLNGLQYRIGLFQLLFILAWIGAILVLQSFERTLQPAMAMFVLIFLLSPCMCLGSIRFKREKIKSSYGKIEHLCNEASKENTLVSYHFREDIGDIVYIEVSISDQPVDYGNNISNNRNETPEAVATPLSYYTPCASTPEATTTTTKLESSSTGSAENRLEELMKIKDLLTSAEYDNKRNEILSAV